MTREDLVAYLSHKCANVEIIGDGKFKIIDSDGNGSVIKCNEDHIVVDDDLKLAYGYLSIDDNGSLYYDTERSYTLSLYTKKFNKSNIDIVLDILERRLGVKPTSMAADGSMFMFKLCGSLLIVRRDDFDEVTLELELDSLKVNICCSSEYLDWDDEGVFLNIPNSLFRL